jgi:hypothetical protein
VKHDCLEDSAPLRSACIECLGSCKRSYDARVRPDLAACLTNNRGRMPRDIPHLPHILDSLDFAGILVVVLGALSITGQRAVLGGDEEGRRPRTTPAASVHLKLSLGSSCVHLVIVAEGVAMLKKRVSLLVRVSLPGTTMVYGVV